MDKKKNFIKFRNKSNLQQKRCSILNSIYNISKLSLISWKVKGRAGDGVGIKKQKSYHKISLNEVKKKKTCDVRDVSKDIQYNRNTVKNTKDRRKNLTVEGKLKTFHKI